MKSKLTKTNLQHRNRVAEVGSVMLEFALMAPVLLALVLGTFEISKMFRIDQGLMSFSRGCAQATFRTCILRSDKATCLNDLRSQLNHLASLAVPGAEVVLSMYKYEQGMLLVTGSGGHGHGGSTVTKPPPTVKLLAISGTDGTGRTPAGNYSKYIPPAPSSLYDSVLASNFRAGILQGSSNSNADLGRIVDTIGVCEVFSRYEPVVSNKLQFFKVLGSTRYEDSLM